MILDTTTRSIELILGGAVTTNELPWVVAYADHTDEAFTPAADSGVSNGATAVTVISAPAASTQRQVKHLNVYNADTVDATVTIRFNDNTALRNLIVVTLPSGYQLNYTDTGGWVVLDASGRVLMFQVLSGEAIPKDIVTAKGDLIVATASAIVDNLAAPSKDFSKLYRKTSETTGLAWGLRTYVQLEPFSFANGTTTSAKTGASYLVVPAHLDGLDLSEIRARVLTPGTGGLLKVQLHNESRTLSMSAAIADDGGTQTDETTEANNATSDDMTLLPATPAVNDAYYFGGPHRFDSLNLDISTAGAGTWTIVWEYWDGTAWSALADVTDGTTGFTTGGLQNVSYTMPFDWATTTVNSQGPFYYIRARVSAFTSITTQPLGEQSWVLGVDMLSTPLTIDASEHSSQTAATPPVIDTNYDDVSDDDLLRLDVIEVHSTTAAIGLNATTGWA